ncbi:MAG TPA: hypothetical protein VIK14_03420 [Ignavibacteria bacterium]
MEETKITNLLADLVKKPVAAIAFVEDVDKYLSGIGLVVSDEEKTILKSIAEDWRKQGVIQNKGGGGHINFTTHTNSTLLSGHWNTSSHTNHTSKI